MSSPESQNSESQNSERKNDEHKNDKHHHHAVYASETTGLLVIAFLLLILTLIRYWHDMNWSWR